MQYLYVNIAWESILETIQNPSKGEHDAHYDLDGVHPQHITQLAYGSIKKGQDKVVKSNSERQRININGALNGDRLEVVIHTDNTINTQSTLKLVETLEKTHPDAFNFYYTGQCKIL